MIGSTASEDPMPLKQLADEATAKIADCVPEPLGSQLDGRRCHYPAAPFWAIRLGRHQNDLMPAGMQHLQRRHGKLGRPHEYDSV